MHATLQVPTCSGQMHKNQAKLESRSGTLHAGGGKKHYGGLAGYIDHRHSILRETEAGGAEIPRSHAEFTYSPPVCRLLHHSHT
eukprot:768136-Hanusia_phi.AAC.1